MSIYTIDVHQITHTCPADPDPHPIVIYRNLVHVVPGRPCQQPVTITCGTTTATIPCHRHEPAERQCLPCRTIVVTRSITTEHLGYQGPAHLAPTGGTR